MLSAFCAMIKNEQSNFQFNRFVNECVCVCCAAAIVVECDGLNRKQ